MVFFHLLFLEHISGETNKIDVKVSSLEIGFVSFFGFIKVFLIKSR